MKALAKKIVARISVLVLLGGVVCAFIILVNSNFNHIPLIAAKQMEFSIGIYGGSSPFDLHPLENVQMPVLTAREITDVPARHVADPFMTKEGPTWYMFFEVLNRSTGRGEIGYATSDTGSQWKYEQIVLKEPFHLSYPYVFKYQNEFYMIPESHEVNAVRLYKATHFPRHWTFVKTLLSGKRFADSSVLQYQDRWWMFTATSPQANKNDTLRLYVAEHLEGPWREHPKGPIVSLDARIARPGGRILVWEQNIFRFAQDNSSIYGRQVWAFKITELTTTGYQEELLGKLPIIGPSGVGWNRDGMHQIDPYPMSEDRWIACVDGGKQTWVRGWDYYVLVYGFLRRQFDAFRWAHSQAAGKGRAYLRTRGLPAAPSLRLLD